MLSTVNSADPGNGRRKGATGAAARATGKLRRVTGPTGTAPFDGRAGAACTRCGGINPYTITARLGPGGLAHHETVRGLIQLLGVSRKETRHGDQVRF